MIEEIKLTAEEQVLLSSFDSRTNADCLDEAEELLAITSTDDEVYSVVSGLYEKLNSGIIDVQAEIIDLDDEESQM